MYVQLHKNSSRAAGHGYGNVKNIENSLEDKINNYLLYYMQLLFLPKIKKILCRLIFFKYLQN